MLLSLSAILATRSLSSLRASLSCLVSRRSYGGSAWEPPAELSPKSPPSSPRPVLFLLLDDRSECSEVLPPASRVPPWWWARLPASPPRDSFVLAFPMASVLLRALSPHSRPGVGVGTGNGEGGIGDAEGLLKLNLQVEEMGGGPKMKWVT